MRPCPECGLSIDDGAGFCATCGWRPEAAAQAAGGIAPADAAGGGGPARPTPVPTRRASLWESVWSAPKQLWAIPIIAVFLAAHLAFPHLPWSRYAVRFDDTWDTDPLRVAASVCVVLAAVTLFLALARLSSGRR